MGVHQENRFLILFVGILFLILLSPLSGSASRVAVVVDLGYSFHLLSSIFAVSRNRRHALVVTIAAVPFFLATWGAHFYSLSEGFIALGVVSGILFFGSTIYIIFKGIITQKIVNLEVIYGAVVVYLLMGLLWALVFGLIYLIDPTSFSFANGLVEDSRIRFMYLSYVTLTTLGYGDITPLAPAARSFAMLEAIIGQIYLVVLVAWLVGMYVSQGGEEQTSKLNP